MAFARATLSSVERGSLALPDGDSPPAEFRIFRAGTNESEKGRFLFDDEAAKAVMSFWADKGTDLAFDYEHQALADPPIKAPAAGWWTPQIRNGELWATNIRWTPEAAAHLKAKEYRYFSPAFSFDKENGRVTRVFNCALTNIPALDRIAPLMAARAKGVTMNLEEMTALVASLRAELTALAAANKDLGDKCAGYVEANAKLSAKLTGYEEDRAKMAAKKDDDGDEDDAEMSAVVGLKANAGRAERLSAVRSVATLRASLIALTGADSDAAALGTLSAWKAEAADAGKLKAEKAELEASVIKSELDGVIASGIRDGKIPPSADHPLHKSSMAGAMAFGGGKPSREGVAWLRAHVGGLSKMVADGNHSQSNDGMQLTEAQARIARNSGVNLAEFAKFQASELAAGRGHSMARK